MNDWGGKPTVAAALIYNIMASVYWSDANFMRSKLMGFLLEIGVLVRRKLNGEQLVSQKARWNSW